MKGLVTVTTARGHLSDIAMGQIAEVEGRSVRLYPASETTAHVYPDWPGRNRKERRSVKAEARASKA